MKVLPLTEQTFLVIGLGLGLIVSFALAPKDAFFLGNFTFYWVSQLAVVALVLLPSPRPAVIATVSFALATLLLGFWIWVATRSGAHPDGGAWLLYLVLLFGAGIGGFCAACRCHGEGRFTLGQTILFTGIATLAGTCLVAALVFSIGFIFG